MVRTFGASFTQGGLYYISIYRHDEHVHQSHKTLWCRIIHLVLPAPAGWYRDTEQQDDSIDEEHANGLRDGDVKRTNLLVSHLLYYLVGIRLRISVLNHQIIGPGRSPLASFSSENSLLQNTCQPVVVFTMTGR